MTKKKNLNAEIAGWYGTATILLAYFSVSFGIIKGSGALFQILNLTGAIGIIISSYVKRDTQPVVLNVFWAIIAIIALLKLLLN